MLCLKWERGKCFLIGCACFFLFDERGRKRERERVNESECHLNSRASFFHFFFFRNSLKQRERERKKKERERKRVSPSFAHIFLPCLSIQEQTHIWFLSKGKCAEECLNMRRNRKWKREEERKKVRQRERKREGEESLHSFLGTSWGNIFFASFGSCRRMKRVFLHFSLSLLLFLSLLFLSLTEGRNSEEGEKGENERENREGKRRKERFLWRVLEIESTQNVVFVAQK